eukprot:COSAG05_NODE_6891_length_886_cov_1.316391_2_plen_66_part_01
MQCAQHSILFFQSGSKIKNTRALLGYFDLRKCPRPDHWANTNSWTPIASMGTARYYLGITTFNNNL